MPLIISSLDVMLLNFQIKMEVPISSDFGFGKIKGHRTWPCKRVSETSSKVEVSFLGSDKFGSVLKKSQGWIRLDLPSLKKFCSPKMMENKQFADGVHIMVNDFAKYSDKNSVDKKLLSYLIEAFPSTSVHFGQLLARASPSEPRLGAASSTKDKFMEGLGLTSVDSSTGKILTICINKAVLNSEKVGFYL